MGADQGYPSIIRDAELRIERAIENQVSRFKWWFQHGWDQGWWMRDDGIRVEPYSPATPRHRPTLTCMVQWELAVVGWEDGAVRLS